MVKKLKSPRRLAALAVFAIIAVSAFGFAANNSFAGQNRAGNGTDGISGFQVSNIHYTFESGDAAHIGSMTFDLNHAASDAQVRFDAGAWTDCGASAGGSNTVTCTFAADSVLVHDVAQLEVSAVS
ncbi:MAG: hypothetical protein U0837_08475 [Dehalococcoidia bacterium]|jgi:hypothetical protein